MFIHMQFCTGKVGVTVEAIFFFLGEGIRKKKGKKPVMFAISFELRMRDRNLLRKVGTPQIATFAGEQSLLLECSSFICYFWQIKEDSNAPKKEFFGYNMQKS